MVVLKYALPVLAAASAVFAAGKSTDYTHRKEGEGR